MVERAGAMNKMQGINEKERKKVREKSESYGSIEKMWKKKRGKLEEEERKEVEKMFRSSKKTMRSQEVGKGGEV